jgi:hypothetical protein
MRQSCGRMLSSHRRSPVTEREGRGSHQNWRELRLLIEQRPWFPLDVDKRQKLRRLIITGFLHSFEQEKVLTVPITNQGCRNPVAVCAHDHSRSSLRSPLERRSDCVGQMESELCAVSMFLRHDLVRRRTTGFTRPGTHEPTTT